MMHEQAGRSNVYLIRCEKNAPYSLIVKRPYDNGRRQVIDSTLQLSANIGLAQCRRSGIFRWTMACADSKQELNLLRDTGLA